MTNEQCTQILESAEWQTAKSKAYKKHPHQYSVVDRHGWNPDTFRKVTEHIYHNGVEEKFYSMNFRYFYAGSFKYWICGEPSPTRILINRAKV